MFAFFYLATLCSALDPIIDAYKSGNYLIGIGYTLFFLIASILAYFLRPRHIRTTPPLKGVFQGVGKLSEKDAWPRINVRKDLCRTIKQSVGKPILLVGSSGVGKYANGKWDGTFILDCICSSRRPVCSAGPI